MNEKKILVALQKLKNSARLLRSVSSDQKNRVLMQASRLLESSEKALLKANAKDLTAVTGKSSAFMDRLTLTTDRIHHMAESLRQVAHLEDPLGEEVESRVLKNGLKLRKIRSPLGVIFMIFESRPNVAVEAFSLAFKAGNAIILKGGRDSRHTTEILYRILTKACRLEGVAPDCLWGLRDSDRSITSYLLTKRDWIDVVVPRGGSALIDFVTSHSKIPLILNDRGLCHVYVHADADPSMAVQVILNAKTQRPGVCNSMETLLIHKKMAPKLLPILFPLLGECSVKWLACPKTFKILKKVKEKKAFLKLVRRATPECWNTEYLDLKMNCRIVDSMDEAIEHIDLHGSRHSESILTGSFRLAKKFQNEVDAAVVYWNASTRFTDGFEFGLGGELGISTQKLHVRGPVGLKELTSLRWIVEGTGQVRK